VTTEKDRSAKERKFVVQDKEFPAKGGKPAFHYWEFTDVHGMSKGPETWNQLWYSFGGVYDTPDAEIALVASVPVQRGDKAAEKHAAWCTTMVKSGVMMSEKELAATKGPAAKTGDAKKEGKSEPPARTASLEAAKKNIAGLKGWDLFTSESYLVLFSWDPDKPEKRPQMEAFSKELVGKLEKMRALFQEGFPAHDNMAKAYSVVRVCYDEKLFQQYSRIESKRDGAFNPGSMELVLYKGETVGGASSSPESVVLREGWLQYSTGYFRAPRPKNVPPEQMPGDRPRVEVQVWFDEGVAEYFGGFTGGSGKWVYQGSRTAKQAVKAAANENRTVALRELVNWTRDRFTGSGLPGYLAQAYVLVDLLRRGKKELGAAWDPAWDKVLDTYRDKMLETGEYKKAVEAAFAGVDWEKLEGVYGRWIKEFLK
jgi:hypothetical protein